MAVSIKEPCRRAHDFENWRRDIKYLQMVRSFIVYRQLFTGRKITVGKREKTFSNSFWLKITILFCVIKFKNSS